MSIRKFISKYKGHKELFDYRDNAYLALFNGGVDYVICKEEITPNIKCKISTIYEVTRAIECTDCKRLELWFSNTKVIDMKCTDNYIDLYDIPSGIAIFNNLYIKITGKNPKLHMILMNRGMRKEFCNISGNKRQINISWKYRNYIFRRGSIIVPNNRDRFNYLSKIPIFGMTPVNVEENAQNI